MESQTIPLQVWDWALRWIPPGLMIIGASVVGVWWKKGKFPIVGGEMKWRRLDDKLLDRLLDIQEANTKAVNNLAEAIREQSNGMWAKMHEHTTALTEAMVRGLREIHQRFDEHIAKRGPHHARQGEV